jgi:hypothetical protein
VGPAVVEIVDQREVDAGVSGEVRGVDRAHEPRADEGDSLHVSSLFP